MAFTLAPLPYAPEALEPFIDAETMKLHHDKHHQTYVDKLNAAIEGTERADKSIEELLQSLPIIDESIRGAVRNHGGGHYNHTIFWQMMSPERKPMSAALETKLTQQFGSVEGFQKQFTDSALAVFGSGRTRLLVDRDGDLSIVNTPNQDSPISKGEKIVLGLDVREHAYYLKCQNRRAEYIANRWNVVNREYVAKELKM